MKKPPATVKTASQNTQSSIPIYTQPYDIDGYGIQPHLLNINKILKDCYSTNEWAGQLVYSQLSSQHPFLQP
jgi:hypothetical protein